MNDFFARQDDARRQSGRLVVLFALAVAGVALAVYLVALLAGSWAAGSRFALWQPRLFAWTTSGTLLFVAAASLWKMQELASGGAAVARALGGKLVPPQTQDPQERTLRNVVEEMAIASGTPVPDIYLLESEGGINAFAAGHGTSDAAICVTRGSLELLSRDELQGVVAHEFSHILNGDMLLNLRLLGWLNGILVVSQLGEIMFRGMRRSSGRSAAAIYAVAAGLYVIGYLGYFFGRLIKCAVARQREYLGDASAVQFTRNPEGLAGALKKIGGLTLGSRLQHPHASEMSHMFFGNALEKAWLHALDTHPPLEDRIRRLEPRFDGRLPKVQPARPLTPATAAAAYVARPAPAPPESDQLLSGAHVSALLNQVGEPLQQHLELARRTLAVIPDAVRAACREPLGACALIYGLLLDRDPAVRARQEQIVGSQDSPAVLRELRRLFPELCGVPPQIRLPLLDLALPALRSLSPQQFTRLKSATELLSAEDGRETLFEFALRYLLLRHLEPRYLPRPSQAVQIYALRGVQQQCSCVLSSLARAGHRDEESASAAFDRGALILREPKADIQFLPSAQCRRTPLMQALATLEGTTPQIKRRLLAACLECLVHDGVVKVDEIELFRAFADALGCPIPPWLHLGSDGQQERRQCYGPLG
jgi:Zn-dependent protease with chaperone function